MLHKLDIDINVVLAIFSNVCITKYYSNEYKAISATLRNKNYYDVDYYDFMDNKYEIVWGNNKILLSIAHNKILLKMLITYVFKPCLLNIFKYRKWYNAYQKILYPDKCCRYYDICYHNF